MSNTIDYSDYEEQYQEVLNGLPFLDFDEVKREFRTTNPLHGLRSNKILLGETIRGMKNVHPLTTLKIYNRSPKEISKYYFPDAEKKFLEQQGINLNIDVDCEAARELLVNASDFFYDYNNNNKQDNGEHAFKLFLFASKDGLKLQEAFECLKTEKGQIFLFVEDNTDDWSKQVVRIKIADDVRASIKQSDLHHKNVLDYINKHTLGISQEGLKQLIEIGEITEKLTIGRVFFTGLHYLSLVVNAPLKAVGWLLEQIAIGINALKIGDSVWDTQNADYLFTKENLLKRLSIDVSIIDTLTQALENDGAKLEWNDLIPDYLSQKIKQALSLIKKLVQNHNIFVEAQVSSWYDAAAPTLSALSIPENIAFVAGIYNGLIDFIASTLKFVADLAQAPFDVANSWQEFLETVDAIFESISTIDWQAVWQGFTLVFEIIKAKLKDQKGNLDWVRVAYIVGFAIAFAGTMFIPVAGWVGKIAKLDKLVPEELLTTLQKTMETLKTKGKNAKQSTLRSIQKLFAILAQGKDAITSFFTKLADDIAAWFLRNKERFEGFAKKIKDAFSKDGKTEEFFRKIEKKFNLAGEEILTSNDIKKLRRLLKETFDVPLEFVDQNLALKAKLKDWQKRRVAGSFNMIEGKMYLRKSVTAYTVQHEMFHMKLWYKMTKEFPELQPLFQKTLGIKNRLFHEEYVLAQFMQNPNKWKEVDLLNDLKFVNELRGKKGLPDVDLEYYKKWNLEQELLKFN